jgi:hypothetical protein
MAKKTSNLEIVQQRTEAEKKKWSEEYERWETAEKELRIPAHELKQRVRALRDELERYRAQLEAVPFDIPAGDFSLPKCLDNCDRKYTRDLVDDLDKRVKARFEMIDAFAKEHGCHENLDFQAKLFELKMDTAETGFKIGILAGVIFAGCSKEQVDRFERGMVFSLTSDNRMVKGVDHGN